MSSDPKSRFARAFAPWARRVRARAATKRALTGAAIGLALGAAATGVLWKTRQGALRPWMGAAGLLGAAAGVVVASRKRWQDGDIALYLDARLGTGETVATAVGLRDDEEDAGDAGGVVLSHAVTALERGDRARVRPPVLAPAHVLVPLGVGLIAYLSWLPLPPSPVVAGARGADDVTLAEVKGLERVAELGKLSARDDEQKKRLDKIAKDAAALREKLAQGMERREALAEIARLSDAVQAERLSLGDGESRRGLEAALQRLAQDPLTQGAAKALGDRDLVRFDEEMQKLANQRESADRDRAKKALEEAAEAARKNGAADVGKALDKERALFDERGKRADELKELKELEEALRDPHPDSTDDDGPSNGAPHDDRDARRMAKSMSEALKKLTPEERKRLADKLKKRLAEGGATMTPGQRDREKELARKLGTPEGQKELEDELKRLAAEDTDDDEAERQKKLDDAERGLGEAQKGLGQPIPVPGGESASGGPGDSGRGGGPGGGNPGGRGGPDTGTGDHKGLSKDVKSEELRSRANAKLDGKAPTAGVTMGRSAGRAGDTANVQGTGALGKAGPGEVNGVDQSEVPEEYREQVGRYFTP